MIVAIHQPQFMPWLGYFDKMDQADLFVRLDTVQYKEERVAEPERPQDRTGTAMADGSCPVPFSCPHRRGGRQ